MIETTENTIIMNEPTEAVGVPQDPVNHPSHYISKTGLQSIDVIKSFTDDLKGFEAVATANALKYLMRWKNKNGIQDLEKARWYINELIMYEEGKMMDV